MAKILRQRKDFVPVEEIVIKPNIVDTAKDVVEAKPIYPPKKVSIDKDGKVLDANAIKLLLDFYHIDPQKVWVVKDWKNQWKVIDFGGKKYYFPKEQPESPMKVNI